MFLFRSPQCSIRFVLVIGALLAGSSAQTSAEDELEALVQAAGRNRLHEAAQVQDFIGRLGLTADQARQLLAVAAEAAPLHVEAYRTRAELQPEMLEAFAAFLAEDRTDRGFTPAVEQRAGRVSHQAKAVEERITARLLELERQASDILTPEQRQSGSIRKISAKARNKSGGGPRIPRGRRERDRRFNADQFAVDDRLEAARLERQQLHQEIRPRVGLVGRNLLHPTAAETLCQIAGTLPNQTLREAAEVFERGTDEYPSTTCDWQAGKIGELRAEISNWNLINGLHLDGKQIAEITAMYDAAAAELRAAGQAAPRKAKRRAGQEREARVRLERSVEQVLNPGQRQVLLEFKACLIPPKNLKSPVRVGQANDHSRLEEWLARARKLREPRLRRAVDGLLAAEARYSGELKDAERTERAALLMATARRAAAMSDVEFEVNKADLAEEIAPRDRLQELKEEIVVLSRERDLPGIISQFMLNPRFIGQLRVRGQQLAERPRVKAVAPAAVSEKHGSSGEQEG